ncbi:uncharacterized protein LOC143020240 [Oratosquilla oratoria]|uniref:uncharacterized protein LOC143020240 n=1 Tax=Oratosquilla oratoria TaxID=337810 RepID=UPI003F76DB8D
MNQEMRICKTKDVLKKQMKVEVSVRNADQVDCTVLNGCAIPWVVLWPTSSKTSQALVSNYVESFKQYLQRRLKLEMSTLHVTDTLISVQGILLTIPEDLMATMCSSFLLSLHFPL